MTKTNAAHQMSEARRCEVARQAAAMPNSVIGKLWHNKRRFSWVIRFDTQPRSFEDGSRWEPVS